MTRQPSWWPWAAAVALVANSFVVVVVNVSIYWARSAFIAAHPDYVAHTPPTISRALSDPAIQGPFATWVALSAVLLFAGVACIVAIQLSALARVRATVPRRAGLVRAGYAAVLPLQLVACVGMVTLSQYTFPDFNRVHMVGSYMFFAAQALVVLVALLICRAVARDAGLGAGLRALGVLSPGANRLRLYLGSATVLLVVVYMGLFLAKGYDLGAWNAAVYLAYVGTEPACISAFLLYMAVYNADLIVLLRRWRGPAAAPAGVSPRRNESEMP